MVSWLIFKSFIHIEFIFVYGVIRWMSLIFCKQISSSPNTICWRGYFYSILCSCYLCQILIDHRDLGLFLGSLFCSMVYVSVLTPVPDCFDYNGLVIQFDVRYCDPSCFVLLSQNCYSYSGSFMVPYEFLKCLFYMCERCNEYFNRDCIESINCFG